MKRKTFVILLSGIFLLQFAVPVRLIVQSESRLKGGSVYRFLVSPVDPLDPFSGRYVALNVGAFSARTDDPDLPVRGGRVYAVLGNDSSGFARIRDYSTVKPEADYLLLKVRAGGVVSNPFSRYYLNEKKAPDVERLFAVFADAPPERRTYIVVKVRRGRGTIAGLCVNGRPAEELSRDSP